MLSPFGSKTSRNQPSNNKFIFGPSAWMRGLIKPGPGQGVAYIDWSQQEFGIAAALSGDPAMIAAYHSGDPYLEFAKQAGAVPPDATKSSHGPQREQFKACVLAVQYGMEAESLGLRIGAPAARAAELLYIHRDTYPDFWRWSDAVVASALLSGSIRTRLGWMQHVAGEPNPRSLANFHMQAHGAEIMRVAAILATEAGVEVVAPVHDAFMIAAPLEALDGQIAEMAAHMDRASEIVLSGFRLRSDTVVVRYPDRYMDKRGKDVWTRTAQIVDELEGTAA
jgi:DNA polymerase I-like protein with 3'-5' exonuclease and polymerase domains